MSLFEIKHLPGKYLPACLIIHIGNLSGFSPLAAFKILSFFSKGKFKVDMFVVSDGVSEASHVLQVKNEST